MNQIYAIVKRLTMIIFQSMIYNKLYNIIAVEPMIAKLSDKDHFEIKGHCGKEEFA